MTQPDTAAQIPPSGKAVAKQASRYSAAYWSERVFRPTYRREKNVFEVQQWYARIQCGGRRESVGLGTNTQDEAARRAARLFKTVQSRGWQAALTELNPEKSSPRNLTTVGGYLETCEPLFLGRKVTWANYAYALRKIAREIHSGKMDDDSKFDPFHKPWQKEAAAIKLSELSPASIVKWKRDFIAAAGDSPTKQLRARRNVNSFLINARTLFGPKMAKCLAKEKLPPVPSPFDGVDLENAGNLKYVSSIQAGRLLQAAKKELGPEAYKVVLLALGAGLRRGEIDMLERSQIDSQNSLIQIVNTEFFRAKSDSSLGVVYVDTGLLTELQQHVHGNGRFVIDPTTAPGAKRGPGYCRCKETFKEVSKWLRDNGVDGLKPLHSLRKEFGSVINHATDIHTASRQLRHSTIKMTAAVYTDHRRRAASAVPIGDMLKPKGDGN